MTNRTPCKNCINNKNSIFNVLTAHEKAILEEGHFCKHYKKDEIIFREHDIPIGLIYLSEGKAKLFKEGVGKREQIVRMAKSIGFIGYRALFAGDKYESSAVAIENCTICVIRKENIFEVLKQNNELAISIIQYMANELGVATNRIVTLTQKHIRGRLAESLLFLKEIYGTEDDNKTLKIYLAREDIASLSNMTTANAIRTLSNFAEEKVISIKGRRIKILNLKELERISELG